MAITMSSVYSTTLPSGTTAASTWTITGIAVPEDATACIFIEAGYTGSSATDQLDIANLDGDTDKHFTQITYARDQVSTGNTAAMAYVLKYGETGFPTRGATGLTFTGSFVNTTAYGRTWVAILFLSGTVTDNTLIIGSQSESGGSGSSWTSSSLGSVGASDLSFIVGTNYGAAVDANPGGSNQTAISEDGNSGTAYWGVGYEYGEATPTLTVGKSFFAGIAFAVKAAAASGLSINVSECLGADCQLQ